MCNPFFCTVDKKNNDESSILLLGDLRLASKEDCFQFICLIGEEIFYPGSVSFLPGTTNSQSSTMGKTPFSKKAAPSGSGSFKNCENMV